MKKKSGLSNLILVMEICAILILSVLIIILMGTQVKDGAIHATTKSNSVKQIEDMIDKSADNTRQSADAIKEFNTWEPIYTNSDLEEADMSSAGLKMGETVKDGELNIVVMADSIWDQERGNDNVGEILEAYLKEAFPNELVHVYNLAIGGTTASLAEDTNQDVEGWTSINLTGVIYALTGRIDASEVFAGTAMVDILPQVDLSKVDYFITAYGLNDYFCGRPVTSFDRFDLKSYVGALEHAIFTLSSECPNSRFVVMTPSYCQFYYYDQVSATCLDRYFGEGGTLDKYVGGSTVASLEFNTLHIDSFNDFGLGADTQPQYTKDGTHFNNEGRKVYARHVADFLIDDYKQVNE